MNSEFDGEAAPTRSPSWIVSLSVVLTVFSGYLLVFVGRRTDLNGSQNANLCGWILGALIVPALAVLFRGIEASRREKSDFHLSNREIAMLLKYTLLVSVLLAAVHGAAFSLEMR